MNIAELREWIMLAAELFICYMLVLEYNYDAAKDEIKKQRRTKTTKKAVTSPSGDITTEEITETIESKGEENAK